MNAIRIVAVSGSLTVGALLPSLGFGAAQDAPPKIREFDIPTIERLGQEIYTQDQFAWKATDIARAQRGGDRGMRRDGMKGWITESAGGKDIVRMIRVGRGGPEALYDVTFVQGSEPVFSTPTDRTLTADEIAQYNARMLALNNIKNSCSDRYNTVALKDPESDGWLVWALASTTDPNILQIGGHYRFTISADGRSIRSTDALFRGCLQIDKREQARAMAQDKDLVPFGAMVSHLVSLTPVETHAFASLTYQTVIHVGTPDGYAWRIDGGRITRVEEDSPDADGFAARTLAGMDENCVATVSNPNQIPRRYFNTKGAFKLILMMEREPSLSLKLEPGFELVQVICIRRSIVPSPNDYKVVIGGTKLLVSDVGEGHSKRDSVLQRVDGKFQFEIKEGEPLTDDLRVRVDTRLKAFENAAGTAK
jgi:hypothetical protein